MLLIKVEPLTAVVALHHHACLKCDHEQCDPTLEMARPAGGWIIETRDRLAWHKSVPE
jgi:hypothetical protein